MTVLYEVQTKHTKEMMKAFAKLNTEMSGSKPVIKIAIFAAVFFMLPRALRAPGFVYVICWGVGILALALIAARWRVMYLGLLLQNSYYKEGIPITMQFGNSKFEVRERENSTCRYSEIKKLYIDKDHFFFHMEDASLFVIPKSDFVKGDAEAFREFMQRNTGKEFEAVNLNLKQKAGLH